MARLVTVTVERQDLAALTDWLARWNANHREAATLLNSTQQGMHSIAFAHGSKRHTLIVSVEERDLSALLEWLRRWNTHADGAVSPITFAAVGS